MVLQIALGVFLGLAAWTYRADLGSVFLFLLFSALFILLIVWFFKSLYSLYKKLKLSQSAKKLASEIVQLGLVDASLEKALFYGLKIQSEHEDVFFILSSRLQEYKIALLNDDEDNFHKMQILKSANEAIEGFKIHRSVEKLG